MSKKDFGSTIESDHVDSGGTPSQPPQLFRKPMGRIKTHKALARDQRYKEKQRELNQNNKRGP